MQLTFKETMRSSMIWRKAPLIAEVADSADERAAVLHLEAEQPVVLEGPAARIWGLIDGKTSEGEMLERLAEHYAEPVSVIANEATAFVDSLAAHKLIEPFLEEAEMASVVTATPRPAGVQVNIIGTEFLVSFGPAVTQDQSERLARVWSRCLSGTGVYEGAAVDRGTERLPYTACLTRTDIDLAGPYQTLQASSFEELAELLTSYLTLGAIDAQAGTLTMLHACGVADPDSNRVVALVAKSGTGKTTASRLLGRTLGYVTDETVAIEPSGAVRAYPKPLSVRNGGRHKEQLGPDELKLLETPERPFIHSIALLNRQDGWPGEPQLELVPLADAVLALIPDTSSQGHIDRPLQALCELLNRTGGLGRITYSEADQLPAIVKGILSKPQEQEIYEWTACFEAVDDSTPVPAGSFRRVYVDDAVEIDGDLLLLSGDRVTRVSGIGPAIWKCSGSTVSREELVRAVTEEHGKPEGYEDLIDEALMHLLEQRVLSDGRC